MYFCEKCIHPIKDRRRKHNCSFNPEEERHFVFLCEALERQHKNREERRKIADLAKFRFEKKRSVQDSNHK
jgi:hypothetical protein